MSTNSLRGGRNIYGPHVLQSNWLEERLEPQNHEATLEKLHQLPTESAKTWRKTSDEYGAEYKEAMQRRAATMESSSWLNYQKVSPEMYKTMTGDAHCNPEDQVSPFKVTGIPEDKLQEYRETWTTGDAERFQRA